MNAAGWYAVHTRHDKGELVIFVHSNDAAGARRQVVAAERCPVRAIISVERRPPEHSLQPEVWLQVANLGYEIIRSDDDDDFFVYSARHHEEESPLFDTATEAAEALIKEKSE